ncbi:cupin domain-containing protein [Amycolatopsis acidicola]|uniref:Cupin domain-containing protein n=1 Tax=Amycolatopsis acidicola TaxID=2596893 RepID=A0A5N0V860_9PSEU|nr:cupin domain-containing protein [Amycolatopsis acidicola]KAA9161874.1 cupin domain-containing protein [Amycolatopsis acidicola]
MTFQTAKVEETPETIAPDGSRVRPLCTLPERASFARFELAPEQVSQAVSHATVEEIWYVIGGAGRIWRAMADREEVTDLVPGVCLTLPIRTTFQFRAGPEGLLVVAATVPPWPNTPDEARVGRGTWPSGRARRKPGTPPDSRRAHVG